LISAPSLRAVEELGLPNVTTAQGLMENYQPPQSFDWVVLSEVIEHLRKPADAVKICYGWVAPGGSLVITTPNGHWESDEHLHEFSMTSLTQILTPLEPESVKVEYLRDRENRRRWLTAVLQKASTPQTPDDFHNRQAVAQKRRQRFGK
jgi:2-polyprenyl-3-methyl-5-hydroxy-6-metoxy-1,4-benzoquinol methylase